MQLHRNPLDRDDVCPTANLENLEAPTVFVRRGRRQLSARRSIRDLRRRQTAEQAIADFDHDTIIYGFTKGQFSIIDLIRATLLHTGPAALDVSTWTAAGTDVTTVCEFVTQGN